MCGDKIHNICNLTRDQMIQCLIWKLRSALTVPNLILNATSQEMWIHSNFLYAKLLAISDTAITPHNYTTTRQDTPLIRRLRSYTGGVPP